MVRSELDSDDHPKARSKERERDDDRDRDRDHERSKEKEKIRDREKDRDREKEKTRDRHREKERAKDRDKDRTRDRDRIKDKERDRERGKDKDYGRDHDWDKDYERDRDRDRDNERVRDRDYDRDREHRERDYDRDKDRDRDRDRIVEGSKDLERENERDRNKDKEDKARDASKNRDREKDDKKKDRGKERGDPDRARDVDKSREEDNRRDIDHSKERKKEKDKRDRDMDNDREKEKERGREKERERDNGKEREKEKHKDEAMEREKYKDGRGKEKEQESEKQKDRDKIVDMEVEPLEAGEIDVQDRPHFQESKKGASEISAWVSKSRVLEEKRRIEERNKAEWMAKLLSDQDNTGDSEDEEDPGYSAKDLAGLKVLNGIDKVMEGGAVVLTLKDKNVLEGDDINEDVDELENIEIAQQRARDEAYKAAKKKPGTYEDKFQNIDAARTILPQYDEVMKDEGMELDHSGGLTEDGLRILEELKKKLQGIGENPYGASSSGATVAAEFYTKEEMMQLDKPKKKKKLRKKTVLDLNALEAEAKAEGLDGTDHGSRTSDERKNAKLEKEKVGEELRRSAYLNAYAKAVDASLKLKAVTIPETRDDDAAVVFGGEEDDELERVLQRSRQAALKKQAENGSISVGPQAVVTAVQQSTVEDMETVLAEDNAEKDKGTVVISDMEEFCRSLQLDEILMRRPAAKDAFGEDDEPAVEEKISPSDGAWTEVNEANEDQDMEVQRGEDDNHDEEVISEVSIGKGLAGALQLLKERGTLKETVDWGGRDMDKKKSKLVGIVDKEEKFRNREIILDRVDEFGRTMTPKEAFRKLSHKFHGKGPGKMKLEKKMKQHEKEQKLKQMSAGDTPSLSMEKMREVQAKMHTPYIVISGHIKPGQTSDPRSGFATVEKESVGSLTPMLGDKKVEHFLGIKRKLEDGSMKPPLPKKPKQ